MTAAPLLLVVARPMGTGAPWRYAVLGWDPDRWFVLGQVQDLCELATELRTRLAVELVGGLRLTRARTGWRVFACPARRLESPGRVCERQRGANSDGSLAAGVLLGGPEACGEGAAALDVRPGSEYGADALDSFPRGPAGQHPSPAVGTAGRLGGACERCGEPIELRTGKGTRGGRPPRFCSDRCRQAARRAAQARP